MKKIVKYTWITFGIGSLLIVLVVLMIQVNLFWLFGKIPGLDVLENPKSELASEIYSVDQQLIGKYYNNFNRTPSEYDEIPKTLYDALIATEDIRFYNHSGVDIKGILAIIPSLLSGQRRGSSTLTQQLAKNLYDLRTEEEYQGPLSKNIIVTKVKEWITAIRIERAFSKNEIILMYLNTVDFGYNALGIKSASKKYFNKSPKELKIEEAALLVGLLQGPSYHNPRKHKERAFNRRNTVMSQMVKYGYLSQHQYNEVKNNPIKLNMSYDSDSPALYFKDYIQGMLSKWCKANEKNLYTDGLKIYTTIDSRMQAYAEAAVDKHMASLQKEFFAHWKGRNPWTDENHHEIKEFVEKMARKSDRYKSLKVKYKDDDKAILRAMKEPVDTKLFSWQGTIDTTISPLDSIKYMLHFLHTGFFSLDPHNGHVKAWVGDIDHRFFKYDHVRVGKRQPGSTFKPLLYALAMEMKGFTPDTKVADVPITFTLPGGGTWTPKNSNGKNANEELTLRHALAKSVNTVSAYLIKQVSPDSLVSFANKLGIKGPLDPVPPLCLGTSDVSLYELVSAYSSFVNEGVRVKPIMVLRIEDKYGNVLEEFNTQADEVINSQTAAYMIDLLKGSVEDEGGTSVDLKRIYNIPGEIGGKTGTTQGSSDGWFIGISPDLVSGAWVGGETRNIRFRSMQYGQGAKMALPIWGYYMQSVYKNKDLELRKEFSIKGVSNEYNIFSDSTGLLIDEPEFIEEEIDVDGF